MNAPCSHRPVARRDNRTPQILAPIKMGVATLISLIQTTRYNTKQLKPPVMRVTKLFLTHSFNWRCCSIHVHTAKQLKLRPQQNFNCCSISVLTYRTTISYIYAFLNTGSNNFVLNVYHISIFLYAEETYLLTTIVCGWNVVSDMELMHVQKCRALTNAVNWQQVSFLVLLKYFFGSLRDSLFCALNEFLLIYCTPC